MTDPFANITARVHAFIDGGPEHFDTLARDLFALQYEHVAPYRSFCESRGFNPTNFVSIPSLPASAFRDFEITSLPLEDRSIVFHSSGTTGQTPSRHFHNAESLALYEHSVAVAFAKNLPATSRVLSLTPPPADAPHSSLAHMMKTVQSSPAFSGMASSEGWKIDIEKTLDSLKSSKKPITVMGTAFSFVHLCDAIEAIVLPAGSRVMETGGYKNQSRALPKAELHAHITGKLGVPAGNIHCEYGMCELSSQAYAVGSGQFRFPHWVRSRIISPENGREVGLGETGLLEIVDLANVRSALAIRTADLAVRDAEVFELIGRAEDAEPRGCSLNSSGMSESS